VSETIIRGDDYGIRRPLWIHTFVDGDGVALDLTGMTIRTTYKTAALPAATDPIDASAAIKHFIVIDGTGTVTDQDGLYLETTAAAGILLERLTKAETLALSLVDELLHDIEVTDQNGEISTVPFTDPLVAVDAYTNRTSDV